MVYTKDTQTVDHGPNLDLWLVMAGPCQPLKGLFNTQKFLSQNLVLLAILKLEKALTHRQLYK